MVEQRANLDYGRDDSTRDFVMIDDDGVLVTGSVDEATDGVDDDPFYDGPVDSDYFEREP